MTGNWIEIKEGATYPLSQFVIPDHYQEDMESVLIPYGLVQDRVCKLAADIAKETSNRLVPICILKGAHEFFSDLTRQLKRLANAHGKTIPMSVEFAKVKSYENDHSTGNVKISLSEEDLQQFRGKDLLIVEDIVDTGKTMVALIELLQKYQPASIKVCSLLLKRTTRSNSYVPDYVGFSIPDAFVIGYGLDYNEVFRDLEHIAVINETGKRKYAV
ncbi:hypoxanthine phosphoribosyltransferase 1 [Kappamyces sp. JEL0680]|nr:hypoxanthine phosphoribosyltransferase 1 [Kappamyces sp. JEL0680]